MTGYRFMIVLVHGTWARHAPWTQDGSTLRSVLERELRDAGAADIRFHAFEWSGKNDHRHRRAASICLRKELRENIIAHPDYRHIVIAHSHGGNIALRAVRRSRSLRRHGVAVACLATPFLRFDQQALQLAILPDTLDYARKWMWEFAEKYLIWLPIIIIIYILLYPIQILMNEGAWLDWAEQLFWNHFGHLIPGFAPRLAQVVNLVASLLAAGWWSWAALNAGQSRALRRTSKKLARQRHLVWVRYAYSQPEAELQAVTILSLTSRVDEALAVLNGSGWIHKVSVWVAVAISVFSIVAGIIVAGVSLYLLSGLERAARRSRFLYPLVKDWSKPGVYLLSGSLLLPTVGLVCRRLASIAGRSNLGLGLLNPIDNLLWRVRAHDNLKGLASYKNSRYGVWELLRGSKGRYFHSRVYEFEPCIREIACWIMTSPSTQQSDEGGSHLLRPSTAIRS
jgi:hypothetical protein